MAMGKEMFREKENIFSEITEGKKRTHVKEGDAC